jgi:hypothetical protein
VPQSAGWPEWMSDEAFVAAREGPWGLAEDEDLAEDGDLAGDGDADYARPPGMDDARRAALVAGAGEFTADQVAAEAEMAGVGKAGVRAALGPVAAGRRGPGMPGSASAFSGGVHQPGVGVRVGQAAGWCAGSSGAGPARCRGGRGSGPVSRGVG